MMNIAAKWLMAANVAFAFQGHAWAQQADSGKLEYFSSCGACHGSDGKGAGPIASQLKVVPPDLTQLAKRNGGKFSLNAVYEKINGSQEVKAHGTRDMPIWGYRYSPWPNISPEQAFDPKLVLSKPPGVLEVPTDVVYNPEVQRRILSLIDYLYSIQEK
jgi:mono/diheme cytochrome c family protein